MILTLLFCGPHFEQLVPTDLGFNRGSNDNYLIYKAFKLFKPHSPHFTFRETISSFVARTKWKYVKNVYSVIGVHTTYSIVLSVESSCGALLIPPVFFLLKIARLFPFWWSRATFNASFWHLPEKVLNWKFSCWEKYLLLEVLSSLYNISSFLSLQSIFHFNISFRVLS